MSPEISDIVPILVLGIMSTVTVLGIIILVLITDLNALLGNYSLEHLYNMIVLISAVG